MSWSSAARRSSSSSLSGSASRSPTAVGELRHVRAVVPQRGLALAERQEQHVVWSPALGLGKVLLRVEASVGHGQRRARGLRLLGQDRRAEGGGDGEAGALFLERGHGRRHVRLGLARRRRSEHAELVAAEPVRLTVGRRSLRELRCETREQGVAGGMPERVVVVLEPVQVEDDQHVRHGGLRERERLLEVGGQLAAVAEPRERIEVRKPLQLEL